MDTTKLNREMSKTKVLLMSNPKSVFFSTLVLGLKMIWDDSQPTAYTNGRVVGWNTTFFMSLTRDERVFVMVHETLHVVLKHLLRVLGRDHRLWNAAGDFYINLMLVDHGFKMPKVGLIDPRFRGMSVPEIYAVLVKENFQPPPGMWDDLREPEQDKQTHEMEVQNLLIRATTVTKMGGGAGTVPGDIAIMLQAMLDPKLPWTTILHRWLNARIKTGYNYTRPNRRYPDVFLPSRNSKGLKKLAVFMDVSSSVEDFQFNHMVSELTGVMKRFKPRITLITFNTTITGVHHIKSIGELRGIEFRGRGGTCCECVFDWIEENKPDASIVFTDGEFYWEREKLSSEIVWLINDNKHFEPKFGKAVHYETR